MKWGEERDINELDFEETTTFVGNGIQGILAGETILAGSDLF